MTESSAHVKLVMKNFTNRSAWWSLPLGWRVHTLKQKMSGKWQCRVQHVSHNIFFFSGGHDTPESALDACRTKIKE